MDRLSSCYFCGAALDASLEEHPVVPAQFRSGTDAQQTVVLCGTCQRKLDAVLGTVVDAATSASESGDESADASESRDDSGLESTLGDDDDILRSVGDDGDRDGEPDESTGAEASEMEFGGDRADDPADTGRDPDTEADDPDDGDRSKSGDRKYTRSRGAGFRKEDDSVESGSLTGGAFSDDEDDANGRDDADSRDAAPSDDTAAPSPESDETASDDSSDDPLAIGGDPDERSDDAASDATSSDASGVDDPADGRSAGGSADEAGGSGDGSDADHDRDVTMTRLENTKVMRLLTNREYPVDAEEFVTVAANAYQISRDDCEKVLELAAEHGLIQVEEGHIVGDEM